MMKPLSTALISSGTFTDVDADLFARHVYEQIADTGARAAIESRLAAFYGEPVTLDTVYDADAPLRVFPAPPRIELTASATPLPDDPTMTDLRRWTLAWNVLDEGTDADTIGTRFSLEDPSLELPRAEANAFERALLAFDGSDEDAWNIANHAIVPHPPVVYEALPGPASGSETFDIVDQPRMGVRATLVRNATFPPECRYAVSVTAAPIVASIDRSDNELALEQVLRLPNASHEELLAPLAPLQPTRVEIYFVPTEELSISLPVLLVVDSWDAKEIANVLAQWHASQENSEGRYVLDVSTRGLRLRLSMKA